MLIGQVTRCSTIGFGVYLRAISFPVCCAATCYKGSAIILLIGIANTFFQTKGLGEEIMKKIIRMYTVDLQWGKLKRVKSWPNAVSAEWKDAVETVKVSHPESEIFIYCCFLGQRFSNVFTASSPKTVRQLRNRWDDIYTIDFLCELRKAAVEFGLPPILYAKPLSDGTCMTVVINAPNLEEK